jgi:hypothetical protein
MMERGPNGVRGYHRTETLLEVLTAHGADSRRALEEILYLLKARCIVAEHQFADKISPQDLINISPAGYVHLELIEDVNYLAACAEDVWYSEQRVAGMIQNRIGDRYEHFTRLTTLENAGDLIQYLAGLETTNIADPSLFLERDELPRSLKLEKQLSYVKQQLQTMGLGHRASSTK